MKRIALICVSIFVLTNMIYSQDIINETGAEGKFIIRDSEQQEALVIDEGDVSITGALKIEELEEGTQEDKVVVWSTEDKKFKALYNMIPQKKQINASILAADSWTEDGSGNIYRSTGYVGIGTTTPERILDINPSVSGSAMLMRESDSDLFAINIKSLSNRGELLLYKNGAITTKLTGFGSSYFNGGNVGIGTTTPNMAKLHLVHDNSDPYQTIGIYSLVDKAGAATGLYGSFGIIGEVSGVSSYTYGIYGVAHGDYENYGVYGDASGTGKNYSIYGTASDSDTWAGYFNGKVNIAGKAGINVNNLGDEAQLKIKIGTDNNFGVLVRADEVGSEIGLHTSVSEYSSLAKNCYFDTNWKRYDTNGGAFVEEIEPFGAVVFKNVAPGANPISWTGYMKLQTNGNLVMENPTGGYYDAATNNWVNGSSRTLKQDIITNEIDLNKILEDVTVVNYRFKEEVLENPNASYHIGFIAEDTPKLLSGENQDGMVTGDCIGLLLAVAKEQQGAIKKQRDIIEELIKRIEILENN